MTLTAFLVIKKQAAKVSLRLIATFSRITCQIDIMDSKELIQKICAGDTQAFRIIVEENQRLVYHVVSRMVDRLEDRDDLCQEIFFKIYENLHKFKHESKLSTWITQIAYNRCLNYLEKKRIPLHGDLEPDRTMDMYPQKSLTPEQHAEKEDISQRLLVAIEKLPIQYRTIITLYHLQQMQYREIAEVMQMPEGTVKSYLFRARKWLKEQLTTIYSVEDIWM